MIALGVGLFLLPFLAYAGVWDYGFVDFDDQVYVVTNQHVTTGLSYANVRWAFTSFHAGYWIPLVWLSYMAEVSLFGLNAGSMHFTNLVVHALNVVLVFAILYRTTRATGRAASVAALFAVHPIHVESVAWITERKDVLYVLFVLLAIHSYLQFVRSRTFRSYAALIVLFACSIMAKPAAVTLPLILLAMDAWPLQHRWLGRGWSAVVPLIREKIPLFVIGFAGGMLALRSQKAAGAMLPAHFLGVGDRLTHALAVPASYLLTAVWPVGLAAFYPAGPVDPVRVGVGTVCVVVFASMAFALRRLHGYLLFAGLWFLITLIPTAGIVQVGMQAMADRFAYLPFIGVYVLVVWGTAEVSRGVPLLRPLGPCFLLLALGFSVVLTQRQAQTWASSTALWSHAARVVPDNYYAYYRLGAIRGAEGQVADALAYFEAAVRSAPGFPEARYGLAWTLHAVGRTDEAISQYEQAIHLRPAYIEARNNLADLLLLKGRFTDAVGILTSALELEPRVAQTHANLGLALAALNRGDEALSHLQEAARLGVDTVVLHGTLGELLARQGNLERAIFHIERGLVLSPNNPDLRNILGIVLRRAGRVRDAIPQFRAAIATRPASIEIRLNLALALSEAGERQEAIEELRRILLIDPSHRVASQALNRLR